MSFLFEGPKRDRLEVQSGWYCVCEHGHSHICHENHVHDDESCGYIHHEFSSDLVWQKFFEACPPPQEQEFFFQQVKKTLDRHDLLYAQDEEEFYDGNCDVIPNLQEAANLLWIFWDAFGTNIDKALCKEDGEIEMMAFMIRNMWAVQQQRKYGSMIFHIQSAPCSSTSFTVFYHNDPSQPDHSDCFGSDD